MKSSKSDQKIMMLKLILTSRKKKSSIATFLIVEKLKKNKPLLHNKNADTFAQKT